MGKFDGTGKVDTVLLARKSRKFEIKLAGEMSYDEALKVLYTLTPAILMLDKNWKIVFANEEAEILLANGDVICQHGKGYIRCTDPIAQNFLLNSQLSKKTADNLSLSGETGAYLIPKADGWPMVALLGCNDLDIPSSFETGHNSDVCVTLMIRDANGRHPEQSEKLMTSLRQTDADSIDIKYEI